MRVIHIVITDDMDEETIKQDLLAQAMRDTKDITDRLLNQIIEQIVDIRHI